MQTIKHLLAQASCIGMLATIQPVFAQTPADTSTEARVNDEIIVSARRRDENVQDVPSAVTAIGGDTLSDIGAAGLEDFVRLVPGLNLGDTGFYGSKNFRVRGVATTTAAATAQAPVALYFDEIQTIDPFIPQGTTDFYLTDIERVEVLRGPQGTLFGSGSLSGAVRILTRKPELGTFAGTIEATYESVTDGESGGTIEGMVNIPLGDRFALRIVGYGRQAPGWIDNIFTGVDDINSGAFWGTRAALKGELTDRITVTGSFAYQHDDFDDSPRTFVDGGPGGTREWSVLTSDERTRDTTIGSLVVEWDLDWAALTSATSYLHAEAEPRGGADFLSFLTGFPGTAMWQDLVSDNESFFQELRLASQLDGPFSYLVGFYYSDRDLSLNGLFRNPVVEAFFGLTNLLDSSLAADVKEIALFGEVAYRIRSDLELAAGMRAFKNKFESTQVSGGFFTGFVTTTFGEDTTENGISPRFTLTWEPRDNLTFYGQAARGYRIGQANSSLDASLGTVPRSFEPDRLWNYEIGAKGSFMDGRGRASAALFYIDWDNIQVQLPGPTGPFTGNAGAARIIGLETEFSYFLTERLEIQNSMAITDAELAEDVPNLIQPSGIVGASEGDTLPGAPKFTASTALQYTHEFADGATLYLRGDHQYVGTSRNAFSVVGSNEFGGYHVFNLSAGYDLANGIGLRVYAKNLGDDDGATNVLFGNLAFGNPPQAIRLQPRTLGVSIRKVF